MFSILNRALSWAKTSFGNKFCLKKRSRLIKASDNRLHVKFMRLEIGLLSRDKILSIQNLSKTGQEFLVWFGFAVLSLVAKWLRSKDFIMQTLNILKLSSTQVRIKARRTAREPG